MPASRRISLAFLTMVSIMMFLSPFILAVPGGRIGWFTVMAVMAIIPALVGPGKMRTYGVIAFTLSLLLLVVDYRNGLVYQSLLEMGSKRTGSMKEPLHAEPEWIDSTNQKRKN